MVGTRAHVTPPNRQPPCEITPEVSDSLRSHARRAGSTARREREKGERGGEWEAERGEREGERQRGEREGERQRGEREGERRQRGERGGERSQGIPLKISVILCSVVSKMRKGTIMNREYPLV